MFQEGVDCLKSNYSKQISNSKQDPEALNFMVSMYSERENGSSTI